MSIWPSQNGQKTTTPHHHPHSPCPKNVILLLQSTPWYQAQTPSNTKCSRIWPGDTPIDHLIKKSHPISHHTPRKKSQKPAQFQKSHIWLHHTKILDLSGFYRATGYTISILFRCPSACNSATTSWVGIYFKIWRLIWTGCPGYPQHLLRKPNSGIFSVA